jgi:hypothetical protein
VRAFVGTHPFRYPVEWIEQQERRNMVIEGGCYCGAVRYHVSGEPLMKAQCHCRECQYITGGSPNVFMIMPSQTFTFTQGTTKVFTRSDLSDPVSREFCPACGTHLLTRSPRLTEALVLKVGTMDDPSQYGGPQMAIFCMDRQPFHAIPEGIPTFERVPG